MRRLIQAAACAVALSFVVSSAVAADITVKFTEEEAKAQIALNDIAVKAAGLQAAEAGLVLTRKLQQAMSDAAKPADAPKPDTKPADPAKPAPKK